MPPEETYTTEEVAEILNVTKRTVRNLIKRGRFPNAFRTDPEIPKSHHRIPASDVERFLERQREKKSSP